MEVFFFSLWTQEQVRRSNFVACWFQGWKWPFLDRIYKWRMGLEDDGFRVLIWSWILPMYVEHTRGFLNHLLQVMWGGDFTTQINLVSKLNMFFWQGICCVLGLDWAQKNWITKKLDHFYLLPLFWSFLNIITSDATHESYIHQNNKNHPLGKFKMDTPNILIMKGINFLQTIIFGGLSNLVCIINQTARKKSQLSCT